MKKTGLLISGAMLFTLAGAQPVTDIYEELDTLAVISDDAREETTLTESEAVAKYPFIKFQDQVNKEGEADAYPWLSADGLRMYFVRGTEVYLAERSSVTESFGAPRLAAMDIENEGMISVWLSNDELEMYCCSGERVMHFKRSEEKGSFRYLRDLKIDEAVTGFRSGVSFTPDMKVMMLYNSDESNRLVILDVSADGFCKYRTELVAPVGAMGIGQISKNGKYVYYSVEKYNSTSIFKTELLLIGTSKHNPELLYTFKDIRLGKPSLNYDESLISLNFTSTNSWTENQIVIFDVKEHRTFVQSPAKTDPAQNPEQLIAGPVGFLAPKAAETTDPGRSILEKGGAYDYVLAIENAYPVPSRDQVNIVYHLPVNCAMAELILTDLMGREVLRRRIDPQSRSAIVSFKELQLAQGNYFIWINSNLGISSTHKVSYVTE